MEQDRSDHDENGTDQQASHASAWEREPIVIPMGAFSRIITISVGLTMLGVGVTIGVALLLL